MTAKMTCIGCGSHLSSILSAFREGCPCPECGLPARVAAELVQAWKSGTDDKMIRRVVDAETRAAEAEREAEWRLGQLNRIRSILHEDMPVGFDGF